MDEPVFGIKSESWGKAILPHGNKSVAHLTVSFK